MGVPLGTPLLFPAGSVTTAVSGPADTGLPVLVNVTVNKVAVAVVTVPLAPSLKVTVLFAGTVLNPLPWMATLVAVAGRDVVYLVTTGAVLSTVKVALGPRASERLPKVSDAVPAAMEMPNVPAPAMFDRVTVLDDPLPVTAQEAVAVPVLFNVMLLAASVDTLKWSSP